MAHLLIIELPGGNDTDILQAAIRKKHSFVFLTQNLALYQKDPDIYHWVAHAQAVIELPVMDQSFAEPAVLQSHAEKPFDALLCLLDIRLVMAAKLARRLGLRYLNVDSAVLLRDKFNVRSRLKQAGIPQPEFALGTTNDEVKAAIAHIGLPVLIKPCDGYGSQNILTLESPVDLELAADSLDHLLPMKTDYGLGVSSNDRLLIEQFMNGMFIGCDTFTLNGKHQLLGINEKLMFSPPSFAIRGGCFIPNTGEWPTLEHYVFRLLDAVGFNVGAAHIEIMLTAEGPRLIEINPRLVGAKIARLIGYALDCSVHEALIELHLGHWPFQQLDKARFHPAVTRWLITQDSGTLEHIAQPEWHDDGIKCTEMLARPGDHVSYPFENSQRLGYVMTCCPTRQQAETLAERFVNETLVKLE